MKSFAEFLRWMRCAQTQGCVDYCDHRVQRAKEDLYNALAARDAAVASATIHDEQAPTIPRFLLRER